MSNDNIEAITITDAQIFKSLELVADIIPVPFYWLDLNCIIKGCNQVALSVLNMTRDDVISKGHYEFYPLAVAERLITNTQQVIETGATMEFEEQIIDGNGFIKYFMAVRAPLRNVDGIIIGVVGASIDITAEKESKELLIELEVYRREQQAQARFREFIDKLQNDIQNYKIDILNEKLGTNTQIAASEHEIQLTRIESQILYFLAMNKSVTEISKVLSILESRKISPQTIQSIVINKLYAKFNVTQISLLLEKANRLKLIPMWYDEL